MSRSRDQAKTPEEQRLAHLEWIAYYDRLKREQEADREKRNSSPRE